MLVCVLNVLGVKKSELFVLMFGVNVGLTGVGVVGVADVAFFGGTSYIVNFDFYEEIIKLMMEMLFMNIVVVDL